MGALVTGLVVGLSALIGVIVLIIILVCCLKQRRVRRLICREEH